MILMVAFWEYVVGCEGKPEAGLIGIIDAKSVKIRSLSKFPDFFCNSLGRNYPEVVQPNTVT